MIKNIKSTSPYEQYLRKLYCVIIYHDVHIISIYGPAIVLCIRKKWEPSDYFFLFIDIFLL